MTGTIPDEEFLMPADERAEFWKRQESERQDQLEAVRSAAVRLADAGERLVQQAAITGPPILAEQVVEAVALLRRVSEGTDG